MTTAFEFEDRAVAFIDVLGFRSLVQGAAADRKLLEQLADLVDLLAQAVPAQNRKVPRDVAPHLIPRHIYVSDCIILSAPLSDAGRTNYDGLEIVVMRAIQLTHYFLRQGYLIRGGIAVGKVWHSDSNIVGPAYQEAYCLEHTGSEPMVLLSASAAARCRPGSRMCIRKDGKTFVNGLHDYYIPNNDVHGEIERTYGGYAGLAAERLAADLQSSAHAKWLWFKEYLAAESSDELRWPGAADIPTSPVQDPSD